MSSSLAAALALARVLAFARVSVRLAAALALARVLAFAGVLGAVRDGGVTACRRARAAAGNGTHGHSKNGSGEEGSR
jgi:hypothetical protein